MFHSQPMDLPTFARAIETYYLATQMYPYKKEKRNPISHLTQKTHIKIQKPTNKKIKFNTKTYFVICFQVVDLFLEQLRPEVLAYELNCL